ncbi:hypothetical protein LUZ61_013586 [Rhynchospora tenuis]|uniref:Aminotransferase-like plant mobile domain-containing protein n=1 Tax=Rhynchospora tenuis TaxID=198213 RepID=A0AAD5W9E8_9POAL|nr:hypothetical protein LUZ61_013586 [Rhynchospora tenuis]
MHKPMMARTPQVDQHLTTLGLIHVVQLGHMPVDHTLVQGLALFWRPETHTFHFPHVGEMTVSLEDVAFLYGLPVTSDRVVTGRCHFDYIELLSTYALPRDTSQEGKVWSYARLTLCRPTITDDFSDWGLPSIDTCAPYGRRWTTRPRSKKYQGPGYSSGMDYARDVLMKIRPEHVHWRPYDHMRALVPRYAQVDPSLFVVRISCIHYWMVMWHYADRVMHQFMLYQTVPPPRPEAWQRTSQLMGYMFTTYRNRDWRGVFETEVGMWGDMAQARVREERPWSDAIEATYLRWLRVHGGAYVVYIPEETETAPVADMSYLRDSPAHVALVKHTLRDVLRACAWAVKKGFRRAGKTLLTSCSTTLDLVGEPHRIPHVLESKGLPTDIASIPDTSSDEEELPEPG